MELTDRDEPCGRRRVGRLMHEMGLVAMQPKSFQPRTTDSRHALRQPRPGSIHHTDRGGQYAGVEYRKMLARADISQSMSRADNCYDNAFMESCFGTLKTELEMEAYETMISRGAQVDR